MLVPRSQNIALGEVDSLPILDFTGLANSPTDADTRVSTEPRNGARGARESLPRLLGRQAPGVQPTCSPALPELSPGGMW